MPRKKVIHTTTEAMMRRWATAALRVIGKTDSAVEVHLLSDKRMREMEFATMGFVKPVVDVLSFPQPAGFPSPETRRGKRFLGEIYINAGLKKDIARVRHLVIHGLLHLCGYTHETDRDTIRMQREENRILAAMRG